MKENAVEMVLNLLGPLDIREACRVAGISVEEAIKKIRETHGYTPSEIYLRRKMFEDLLRTKNPTGSAGGYLTTTERAQEILEDMCSRLGIRVMNSQKKRRRFTLAEPHVSSALQYVGGMVSTGELRRVVEMMAEMSPAQVVKSLGAMPVPPLCAAQIAFHALPMVDERFCVLLREEIIASVFRGVMKTGEHYRFVPLDRKGEYFEGKFLGVSGRSFVFEGRGGVRFSMHPREMLTCRITQEVCELVQG